MPLKFISELLSTNTLLNFFLFFITFYITYKVLIKFLKQKKVAIIVGISAGLIAMYYIEFNELLFTFNLYGYTGTTLLLIFPLLFAIFFMYARSITQGIRKLFFFVFAVILPLLPSVIVTNLPLVKFNIF